MLKFLKILISGIALLFPFLGMALTVAPAKTELYVNPGDSLVLQFIVRNDDPVDGYIYPRVRVFSEDEGGSKIFLDNAPEIEWVSLPSEIFAPSQKEIKVDVKINVPEDAPPGGHFLGIGFSSLPPKEKKDTGNVAIGVNVIGLVYINVSGQTVEKISISNLNLKSFVLNLPLKLSYTIKNEGNTYIRPRGEIVFTNIFGKKQGATLVNPRELQILPGKEKVLETNWDPKFAFGPYKVNFNISYGKAETLQFSKWIFIASLRQIIIFIIVVFFLVFVVPALIKKYNKWIISRYSQK